MKNSLAVIEKLLKDHAVLTQNQHKFIKGKVLLNDLFSFYDKVVHLIDHGSPTGEIFLNFSKVSFFSTQCPTGQYVQHITR